MDVPLLEQLARQLAQGRREAQHLIDAAGGRYRERAVPQESVRCAGSATAAPNRLLCGAPALSLAALLSERRQGQGAAPGAVIVDLRAAPDDAGATGFAHWIPCLFLLQALAPDAIARIIAPRGTHAALRLVLDAAWPRASVEEDATAPANSADANVIADANARSAPTLVLSEHATRCVSHLPAHGPWIAFAPHAAFAARARRASVSAGWALDIAAVGATPGEWTRRHAASKPVEAMHAALNAFGATPLVQASVPRGERHEDGAMTPAGRRRAGMDVLLGKCVRNGLRTLVWVDAPDRRTSDATLCRAITRRDVGAPDWDRLVVLGWHFAPTFAQHLALRCDARIDVFAVQEIARPTGRGARLSVDPAGFRRVDGLTGAWIDRVRSRSAPAFEWVTVTLQVHDASGIGDIDDWSIDPDHDGHVFRGAWHASRDGVAGLRTARIRVPWRAAPRRVCLRAIDATGGISEVMLVVRHKPDAERTAPPPVSPAPPLHARAEALC